MARNKGRDIVFGASRVHSARRQTKCKPLLSDVRTGARSLVGEKQPAEVARSRQATNTRPLLTAESGVRGEARFLGHVRPSLRSGSARMPLSTRDSEGVRFRCRQVRIQPPALPASGGFFLRSPERITPHFSVTCSLRALHLSLLELPGVLLEGFPFQSFRL